MIKVDKVEMGRMGRIDKEIKAEKLIMKGVRTYIRKKSQFRILITRTIKTDHKKRSKIAYCIIDRYAYFYQG